MALRSDLSLDGRWQFRFDSEERAEAEGWHRTDYETDGWQEVSVPSNWETFSQALFGFPGCGWYRRSVRLDEGWQEARIHLQFDGANYRTTVWVNGEEVGTHDGGFDPFSFDVTDQVNPDVDNSLVVRVDNRPGLGRVPHMLMGWFNYGGIYRSVRLLALPEVHISDVFVRAEPGREDEIGAPLRVDLTVVNEGDDAVRVSAAGSVSGQAEPVEIAGELTASPVTGQPGARAALSLHARIVDATLWSPDEPNLYSLHLTLSQDDEKGDALEVTFGVRKFEIRGTQLYLNGEPILLTGFNRHEEYARTCRVDPGGVLAHDLELIKSLNGNMVRMHYQGHPDLYDLADRMGLLVFAEIPPWIMGKEEYDRGQLCDPQVRETAEQSLRALIGALKNHPSVVIWSVGNECSTYEIEARPLIAHLVDVARSLDDTRPVTYVSNNGLREKCFDLVDLQCINVYYGFRSEELGEFLDKVHEMEPEKPLLITEFGCQSVRGLDAVGPGSEEYHGLILEENWEVFSDRRDFVPGALIWSLADYRIFQSYYVWAYHMLSYGVVDLDRQPKRYVMAAAERIFGEEGRSPSK